MNDIERRRKKIRVVSGTFKWLATGVAVLAAFVCILSLVLPLNGERNYSSRESEDCCGLNSSFSWTLTKNEMIMPNREWIARSVIALGILYSLAGALLARHLFVLFEKGEFFGGKTVGCFKRIGLWVFGWWVVYAVEQLSKLAWSAAPQVSIEVTPAILVGLIIYLIAWIIDEGRMINEEQALTV